MNTRLTSRAPLLGAMALAVALAACSKQEDDRTAGQKLDGAISEAKQSGNEARSDASRAMDNIGNDARQAANATSEAVTDAAIVTKINAALMADEKLKATNIEVKVDNGHVTLTGTAPDSGSQSRATTMAAAIDGVRAVDNKLVVAQNS
jgi:osmotically-inducible protein OsmY